MIDVRRAATCGIALTACLVASSLAEMAAAATPERNFELISKSAPPGRQATAMYPVVVPGGREILFATNSADEQSQVDYGPGWLARLGSPGWADRQLILPNDGPEAGFVSEQAYQAPDGRVIVASNRKLDPAAPREPSGLFMVDPTTQTARQIGTGSLIAGPTKSGRPLTVTRSAPDTGRTEIFRIAPDGREALASELPEGSPEPSQTSVNLDAGFRAGPRSTPGGNFGDRPVANGRRHTVSDDGRRVFFNAGDGVGFPNGPLYRNDAGAGTVAISASRRRADVGALSAAIFNGASADGDVAYFSAARPLTDGVGGPGLYRYVVSTQTLTRLTPTLEEGDPDGSEPTMPLDIRSGWVSDDGSTMVFVAANAFTPDAVEGESNAYAWRDGELRFIGSLGPLRTDFCRGIDNPCEGTVRRISGNGDYAVLISAAPVNGAPTGGFKQLFRYGWDADRLVCVSCRANGTPNEGGSDVDRNQAAGLGSIVSAFYAPRAVTDDGRVFFTARDRLLSQDPSRADDVYEFSAAGLTMLSPGVGRTFLQDNTDDGASVFVSSSAALTDEDRDGGDFDIYALREGAPPFGGPPVAAPCVADACQPGGPVAAAAPSPASDLAGAGNVRAAPRPGLLRAPRVTAANRKRLAAGRRGKVSFRLRGPDRLAVALTARGRSAGRASARVADAGPRTVRVAVRLNRSARRALRNRGRLRVRVSATFGDSRRSTVLTLRRGARR